MKKVFINYSWEHDSAPAQAIYDELSAIKKFKVWKDKEKLLGGIEWRRTLRDTIREADYFICILSKKSINARKGVRFAEIRVALEVLQEFSPGEIFLIPTRVENCKPKFSELEALNYVDLFPEMTDGIKKLLKALGTKPISAAQEAGAFKEYAAMLKKPSAETARRGSGKAIVPKRITPTHEYSVGIVDIDMGIKGMQALMNKMNGAQSFFLFKNPGMPDVSHCTMAFSEGTNFAVHKVPKSYISNNPLLSSDLVACITKHLLTDENKYGDYFAVPSIQDGRFMFLSADGMKKYARKAGCSFNEGIILLLVGQLVFYFTGVGYHNETRGCVMDYCDDHDDIIESLSKRRFCRECSAKLPKGKLKKALLALLKLEA